ncbi:ROK family transcriptional regulator [Edaphobacter aggregans]|uniref:ROK family transcriptional regulator n=1 Tax=Edaphobacter aggregans TaxID=570835 RepID=UPI00068D62C9|nr:ROK family transcriptional regulator [Edaphobacter aggregans]
MYKVVTKSRGRTKGIQRVDLAYAVRASSEVARDINRDVVLEFIRTKQPISRADLSRLSGLRPSTISAIVEQLLDEKWISEGPAARLPRGRRPTLLSLNPDMVILVSDIRPNQVIIAVVDLNGRFLSRETLPLIKDPARGVENIVAAMKRMIANYPDRSFEGIGLSLPGRVDPATQRLILAPNLSWSDYDIKGAIERKIPLQIEMDNAANACLLSELWFGHMDGVREAVLVTISEGVGSAILANGHLVKGKSGLAGEFGHVPIDPQGPRCGCGRRGCWEVFASSRAAINFYADSVPGAPRPTIMELLNLAEDGDEKAITALNRQAAYLGQGLSIIASVLSPEMILLTGGLTTSWKRFGPIVEKELAKNMLVGEAPRISVMTDVESDRLRGAAALVLQRHSGSNRQSANGARPKRT